MKINLLRDKFSRIYCCKREKFIKLTNVQQPGHFTTSAVFKVIFQTNGSQWKKNYQTKFVGNLI